MKQKLQLSIKYKNISIALLMGHWSLYEGYFKEELHSKMSELRWYVPVSQTVILHHHNSDVLYIFL